MIERFNIYDKLIKKNGLTIQIIVAIEELAELQKELTKYMRSIGKRENLEEEIADVEIVLDEIKYYLNLNKEKINRIKVKKLERINKNEMTDK